MRMFRTIRAGAYRWCKGLSNKESRVVTWAMLVFRTIRAGAYRWCKGLSNKESRVVTWAMLAVLGLLTLWTIWDVATSM